MAGQFSNLLSRISTAVASREWQELKQLAERMRSLFPLNEAGYRYGAIASSGINDFASYDAILSAAMQQFPEELNYAYNYALSAEHRGEIPEARLRWFILALRYPGDATVQTWHRDFMDRHGAIFADPSSSPESADAINLYTALFSIAAGEFYKLPPIWRELDKDHVSASLIKVGAAILQQDEWESKELVKDVVNVLLRQSLNLEAEGAPQLVIVILDYKVKKSTKADVLIEIVREIILSGSVVSDTVDICALAFEIPLESHEQLALVCRWIRKPGFFRFSHMFGNNSHLDVRHRAANYLIPPLVDLLIATDGIRSLSYVEVYRLACILYCMDKKCFVRLATHCSAWANPPEGYANSLFGTRLFQITRNVSSTTQEAITPSTEAPRKKLRIALCISGQLRGFKEAIKSWSLLGLDAHDVDTYVHTWKVIGRRFPDALQAHRVFNGEFLSAYKYVYFQLARKGIEEQYPQFSRLFDGHEEATLAELVDTYKTHNVVIEDDRDIEFQHLNTVMKMHYKIESCYEMIERSGNTYDLIVRIRPDLCVEAEEPLDLHSLYLRSKSGRTIFSDFPPIISSGVVTWQLGHCLPLMIGDLIAIGTPEFMSVYAKTYSRNIMAINNDWFGLPKGFTPHTSLALLLMDSGIFVDTAPELFSQNVCDPEPVSMAMVKSALEQDIAQRSPSSYDTLLLDALRA